MQKLNLYRILLVIFLIMGAVFPANADEPIGYSGFSYKGPLWGPSLPSNHETGMMGVNTGGFDIKIVDVRNISGHNPLNTEDPVLNTDGKTYDTPEDLKDCVDNNNCDDSSDTDSGDYFTGCNSAYGKIEGGSTQGGFILFKDPTTGECEKELLISVNDPDPADPAGMTEAFRIENPESGTQSANTVKLSTKAGSGYTMVSPPSGATALSGSSWELSSGTYSMTIEHTSTGKRWRYGFEVEGKPPTLTNSGKVYNFTEIKWFINDREEL